MLTLIPAYGRDYKSAVAVHADWNAGKDFIISSHFHRYSGKPINRSGLESANELGDGVLIRFNKNRKTTVCK